MSRSVSILYSLLVLSGWACAQVLSFPASNPAAITTGAGLNLVQATVMDSNIALIDSLNHSPLENPTIALSKLDLKAPGKARQEYEKGYQALAKKDFTQALGHLEKATAIYPSYVSAFNALGAAHLGLGQSDEARAAFAEAISLDDHLPNSYLNMGCAELALKDYAGAERDITQASSMAPLDFQVKAALAYSQYMNNNYQAVVATADDVHARKHSGAALVHFYAAAAWDAQGNPAYAQRELRLLMKEDPKSPAAIQAKSLMQQLQDEGVHSKKTTRVESGDLTLVSKVSLQVPSDDEDAEQKKKQDQKELAQLNDADALDRTQQDAAGEGVASVATPESAGGTTGYTFHASTDEVAVLFAATDHGRAVPDLDVKDIKLLDGRHAPALVTGFRNEAQLPLRIGLVIDTSASIAGRFKFEQDAAGEFLQRVLTGPEDLGFVVGFSNSILMAQDFTHDSKQIAHSIQAFAPSGGTALWDAVNFAAEKLASHPERQPVAKILIVISDGEDNSSATTAKQAIQRAQSEEVAVYAINTLEITQRSEEPPVGVRALKTLAEMTGGAAFTPGSVRWLNSSLNDLQQVIRSRYLITYKPSGFKRDGSYRRVQVAAEKDGRKLHVVSRSGYYATEKPAN
ncbi:von Willebrand factor, type A [Candidatus Koribacter versatilis Ellin345]|uniref:von Willebrand factor, type A n=1 Tax=Koribacter versatilis (strain Ellin345) TaxID=204669 RepID=Q1IQI3_KORVE|nr:von Willebrand factor, type A [Candidatus Koribacter versatilis Ellin345]